MSCHRPYRRADSPLAARVKAAIAASPHGNVKAFETAAGLPLQSVQMLITGGRQSPERRRLVLVALEERLGLPADEIPQLGGFMSAAPVAAADSLARLVTTGDIIATMAAAGRRFRALAGNRPYPGLQPDPLTVSMWSTELRGAWSALAAADTRLRRHIRLPPPPSFAVWRIAVRGDPPGWQSPETDRSLGRLERLALRAGLRSLARNFEA